MIYMFFLSNPYMYLLVWILLIIAYSGILKKMGLSSGYSFIPFIAEKKIGDTMFQSATAFWHPFILSAIFFGFAMYLDPFADRVASAQKLYGILFLFLAFFNYYFYLIRLYNRLGKSFGKKLLFRICMVMVPPLFLLILGYGRKQKFLHGTPIKLSRFRPKKWFRWILNLAGALVFLAEAGIIVMALGFLTLRTLPPWLMVKYLQGDLHEKTRNLTADGTAVLREENMGDQYAQFASITPSREKFHPDYSNNKSTVVLEYIIGSDLENKLGASSYNIDQMKDATAQGDALTFVVEAGGSQRWFTDEVPERSVGRYVIQNGKMKRTEELDTYTSMSKAEELKSFLKYAKENYPADRYMLALWDHGGGLSSGYGKDALNPRSDNTYGTLQVNEIVDAIKESGIKFDVIGFDACLMQDIEIARVLEPYADYYLASEESEPAAGWFYTSAFAKLAKDPTLPTEEFGKEIVGAYDQYNKIVSDGKESEEFTLSLLDLTYVKPAYEKLCTLFDKTDQAIRDAEADYVDVSAAAKNAYTFGNKEQIDLVHYLELLKSADYNETIAKDEEIEELIAYVKAPIVVRNRRTAQGINGLALTFPYQSLFTYTNVWNQMKVLDMKSQEDFYDDFFSIMAASQMSDPNASTGDFLLDLLNIDYTKEEWYKTGFENYVTTAPMIDIPIYENGNGYSLTLSDKVWDIVLDAKQFYYQETDDGLKYLGMDYVGETDASGHPMITTDGTWVFLDNYPIYYEAAKVRESDKGTVYTGISKAKLNGTDEVILYIEWEPAAEGTSPAKGRITGYDLAENDNAFMEKGTQTFQPGDTLEFLFDYYDLEGNIIETKTDGRTYRVITSDNIPVVDQKLSQCTLMHGIILTDAYQRQFQTEMVETDIN